MSSNVGIFEIVFAFAIAFFILSCIMRFRLVTLGKAKNRFDHFARRIWNMLYYAFGQRRVVSKPFGVNHFVLFWCFMVLLIANTEFLLHGLFPDYISISRLPMGAYYALSLIFDIVSLLALLAVVAAFIRRAFFAPPHIGGLGRDAVAILGMVAVLMLAFFGMHASEIAQGTVGAAAFMPVSNFVASSFMSGASLAVLEGYANVFWWIHAVVLLGFLNYLPYSKHMHILTAIPNCFFRSLAKVNTQPREEFKKGGVFGTGRADLFAWKDLFDSYSCTECGRCSDACPATFTDKPLDPGWSFMTSR